MVIGIVGTLCVHMGSSYAQDYVSGETYYDSTGYVEYRAGNLPIILSAPHGGSLEPTSIPDRDCSGCVYVRDSWTQPITEAIYDEFVLATGCYPHAIINLLHRKKFDANRDIGDAADGNATVEEAWSNYHDFIAAAKTKTVSDYGHGLFLDIHGHAHAIQRIELGYLLSGSELRMSDTALNTTDFVAESSIKSLVSTNIQGNSHSDLLRGIMSFGTLLDGKGFPSVPSSSDPFPDVGAPYFNGGYNTQRHGSRTSNATIDAIQVELNSAIRFDATQRALLATALTISANEFIAYHYNRDFMANYCTYVLSNPSIKEQPSKIKSYPNPAADYLHLLGDLKNVEVVLYTVGGRRLYSQIWSGEGIEVASLPKGYYFIQCRRGTKILGHVKFIKQ